MATFSKPAFKYDLQMSPHFLATKDETMTLLRECTEAFVQIAELLFLGFGDEKSNKNRRCSRPSIKTAVAV
jgi:hypothetical protein